MKKVLLTTALSMAIATMMANPVGRDAAMQKAQIFMQDVNPNAKIATQSAPRKAMSNVDQQPYYIFNADDNQGFVIVSGDNRSEEIIGYSDKGHIDVDNMPDGLQFILNTFESDLKYLDEQGYTESNESQVVSKSRRKSVSVTREPVAPLIKTFWTQGSPFVDSIPGRSAVGCQNTATAQLLYYWHCNEVFGTVTSVPTNVSASGTLEPTTFDFENDILLSYRQEGRYATDRQKREIARFMMYEYYSMHGTSASSVIKYTAQHWGLTGGTVVNRTKYFPDDFERLIYNDIHAGIPVWVGGHSESATPNHMFLIDGYSYDDFFHVNWGWEGICDGYFRLAPLNAYNWSTACNWSQSISVIIGLRGKEMGDYSNRQPDDVASLGLLTYSFTDNSNSLLYNDTTVNLQNNDLSLRLNLGNWSNTVGTKETRTFETEMAVYDMNLKKVGSLGVRKSSYNQASQKVLKWSLRGLQLPDGEYYFVSKSKDINSTGDYHFDYVKGVYCYAKAVVSGNQLSLSLVKAVTIDDYEIIGKKQPSYRTAIKFHATNHSFNKLTWNLSLYKDSVSTSRGPQQDSDELRLQAMSSGEFTLEFVAGTKPCTLILYNKDRATAGFSDAIYAKIPFDPNEYSASTATNSDLSFTWNLKNSSGGNYNSKALTHTYNYTDGSTLTVNIGANKQFSGGSVYGNEINGTLKIKNNSNSNTFEDILTVQIYYGRANYNNRYKSANIMVPVKLAPGASMTVDLSKFEYSDGAFDSENTLEFRIYDGTLVPDANNAWFAEASWTVRKSFNYWDKDGNLSCQTSVPTTVPDAAAVSFKGMSFWTTIYPNSNPNCIYYFDTEAQAKRLRNYQNYNVVIGDKASNITFNESNYAYIPFGFTANKISYTRKMTNAHVADSEDMSWSTICLPFDVQTIISNSVAMEIGTDVQLRKFFGEEYDKVYFDEADQMEAYTPYLIRVSEENLNNEMKFTANNVKVSASLPVSDGNNYNFVGNSMIAKKETGKYVYVIDNSGNKFNYTAASTYKPFYGYMTAESKLVDDLVIYERGYNHVEPAEQTESIHRFPAIVFEYNNLQYEVPAWDEVIIDKTAHTRLQSLNEIKEGDVTVPARTVTSRAWSYVTHPSYDDLVFASFLGSTGNIKICGETMSVSTLTYGEACDLLNIKIADEDRDVKVFDFYSPKAAANFTVPAQLEVTEGVNAGRTFVVEEVGAGTYRNATETTYNVIGKVTTITIPAGIKTIAHSAFHNIGSVKNVVFEENSQTEFIGYEAFESCNKLEEINIPASVQEIEGTAFGGCTNLKKITFEGTEAPRMSRNIVEGGYNNSYAYDPFECSKRFASRTADVTRNKCVIYVPTHAVGNYRNSDNLWADFIFAMPVTPSNDRTSFTSDVPFTIYQFNGTNWVKGGYKAYYVKPNGVKGNSVTMTTLGANIAPAGFGVVLFATAGETNYVFMKPVSETSTYLSCGNNLMKGVVEPKIQMSDLVEAYPENTYYVVKNGNFNQVNSGNLSFGKAYLEIPKAKSKANMIMQYDDDETTTSIRLVNFGEDADSQMYDLQGRRVDNPAKGVYLQNGTKRVVR